MSTRSPSYPDLLRLVPVSAQATPRLYLDPTGSHQSMLDGAWWPRSRNPALELPSLILAIDALRGNVLRLVLAATGWDERPRRVVVGERAISIDYFGSQPASLLTAFCVSSRADLLVIPPTAGFRTADAAMVNAMSAGNRVIATRRRRSTGTGDTAKRAAAEEEINTPQHDQTLSAVAADSPWLGW
jgi:uncharacterized protein DUF5994